MATTVDIEAIRLEIFSQLGTVVGRDDPIFQAALFNTRVLSALAEQIGRILEQAQNDASAATVQQLAVAKDTAERLVTQAGAFIHRQTEETFKAATDRLLERLDLQGRAIEVRLREADNARRATLRSERVSIAAAIVSSAVGAIGLAVRFLH